MYATIFLCSMSAIAYEILLTRVFAISQWHHLSFMVISIALLGIAASGVFLNIAEYRGKKWSSQHIDIHRICLFSLAYSISIIVAFTLIKLLPLDYYKFPVQPVQAFYLFSTYICLSIPFFFMGLIVSSAYLAIPHQTGQVYFMNMLGSALGALLPMLILPILAEGKAIILTASFPLIPYLLQYKTTNKHFKGLTNPYSIWFSRFFFFTCILSVFLFPKSSQLFSISFSEYKALHQLQQQPDFKGLKIDHNLSGRTDLVASPYIRFSPGLSLQYPGQLPQQTAHFKDGDGRLVYYQTQADQTYPFTTYTLAWSGYLLAPKTPKILIIQNGGGSAIPSALSSGPKSVIVIEKNCEYAEMIHQHYHLPAQCISPSIFLGTTSERFDIVHLEDWGTSLPGTAALSINHLFTTDSLKLYLESLTDSGVVILSRRLILPPSNMLRCLASAYAALTSMGIQTPSEHIVIMRNWDSFTLTISRKPIHDLHPLLGFASQQNFDLVWPQPDGIEKANLFNKFKEPYYARSVDTLMSSLNQKTHAEFFHKYLMDIEPQSDNRPFPEKFFRWRHAKTVHQMTGSRLYTLLLTGEIIIVIVFLEALLITCFLMVIPLFMTAKDKTKPVFSHIAYFVGVGAGFILIEMYLIHVYTGFFNDPLVSFSLILATILIASSGGGLISQRLNATVLKPLMLILVLFVLVMPIWFAAYLKILTRLPTSLGMPLSILILIPPGVLMGFPFPMGLQHLLKLPGHRALAWATNGSASVLAAIAAAQLSVSFGLTSLLWCAVVAYAIAGAVLLRHKL